MTPRPGLTQMQDDIFNSVLLACPSRWEAGYDLVNGKPVYSVFGFPNQITYKRPLLATVIFDSKRKGLAVTFITINTVDKELFIERLAENTTYTIYT